MSVWFVLLLLAIAGMVGGLLNAFFAHEGLVLWRMDEMADGRRIWRPGFIGNVLVGAITAVVLAGLYGPLGSVALVGGEPVVVRLTLASLAGALLSGVGGARLLTNEVDKRYEEVLRQALSTTIRRIARAGRDAAKEEDR